MRRLCVYCGSNGGGKAAYLEAANQLGALLAERGIGVVYGGGDRGMMGAVADGALSGDGEVIGVTPAMFVEMGVIHKGLAELKVVNTMHERKALMVELSDGFIALPGGLGTFEELFEVLTWAQLGLHHKPCGILNVDGYFNHLVEFLDHAVQEKFIKEAHNRMMIVEESPEKLLEAFLCYKPSQESKLFLE